MNKAVNRHVLIILHDSLITKFKFYLCHKLNVINNLHALVAI